MLRSLGPRVCHAATMLHLGYTEVGPAHAPRCRHRELLLYSAQAAHASRIKPQLKEMCIKPQLKEMFSDALMATPNCSDAAMSACQRPFIACSPVRQMGRRAYWPIEPTE